MGMMCTMDHFPSHLGTFYLDSRLGDRNPAPSLEMFANASGEWVGFESDDQVKPCDLLNYVGLGWHVERQAVFGADSPGARGGTLPASRYRALIRSDTRQVLSVVTGIYAHVEHLLVAETAVALARDFDRSSKLLAVVPHGRDGADVFVVVRVGSAGPGALCLLAFNTHGGEGAVRFRLVDIDRPTGTLLVRDKPAHALRQSHLGNVEGRMEDLQRPGRGQEWVDDYLMHTQPEDAELSERECSVEQRRALVEHLWPQKAPWILMPDASFLLHPGCYLLQGPLARADDPLTVYTRICDYIDHSSEAREKGDATKDRAERLCMGAGDRLKRAAWKWLLANTERAWEPEYP